jgi:hypothetical protein
VALRFYGQAGQFVGVQNRSAERVEGFGAARIGLGRCVLLLIHIIPDSRTDLAPLFLKQQCNREP